MNAKIILGSALIAVVLVVAGYVVVSTIGDAQMTRQAIRIANTQLILDAVMHNKAANNGKFACYVGDVPFGAKIQKTATAGEPAYDLAPCLVPTYMSAIPLDPAVGYWNSPSDYATGYNIGYDPRTGRITILAPNIELPPIVAITR